MTIQPITIYRKPIDRGIAEIGDPIRNVRVDSYQALKTMRNNPAAYEVEHIIAPQTRDKLEGKPEAANFSNDDMNRFANIHHLDRIELGQAAPKTIEQVVQDVLQSVINSANQIQADQISDSLGAEESSCRYFNGEEIFRAQQEEGDVLGDRPRRHLIVELGNRLGRRSAAGEAFASEELLPATWKSKPARP